MLAHGNGMSAQPSSKAHPRHFRHDSFDVFSWPRMAVAEPNLYHGVFDCVLSTLRLEGFRGLTRGLGASLVGIIPFSAIDLALFNSLKVSDADAALRSQFSHKEDLTSVAHVVQDALVTRHHQQELSAISILGCGAISSVVAQILTYPLAAASARMQVRISPCSLRSVEYVALRRRHAQASGMPGRPMVYSSLGHCLTISFNDGGIRALYAGIFPNMLKSVPSMSISYLVFERVKHFLSMPYNAIGSRTSSFADLDESY